MSEEQADQAVTNFPILGVYCSPLLSFRVGGDGLLVAVARQIQGSGEVWVSLSPNFTIENRLFEWAQTLTTQPVVFRRLGTDMLVYSKHSHGVGSAGDYF